MGRINLSHMGTTANETYAEWLQRKLEEQGLSQRQLGTRLTPNDPEIGRRAVRRYLKGTIPMERSRHAVATALGSSDTGPDSDESEGD